MRSIAGEDEFRMSEVERPAELATKSDRIVRTSRQRARGSYPDLLAIYAYIKAR